MCHRFRLCVVAVFLLPALAGTVCRANEFHVSPAGNDAATGDKAAPLKTLPAAIAAAKRAGAEAAHVILLAPGTYTPTSPILVDSLTLILRAADPAKPPVIDCSSLPVPAERKVLKEAALFFNGGSIVLEDLRIIRTPTDGVRAEQVNPFQMRRCTLEDIYGHGVRVAGGGMRSLTRVR